MRVWKSTSACLPDGSYLSRTYASTKDRRKQRDGIVVRVIECRFKDVLNVEPIYRLITTIPDPAAAKQLAALYHERWEIGVSSQGHIVQSVKDRPTSKDSGLVAMEAPSREGKTAETARRKCGYKRKSFTRS
jgi:hypothetical protein